MDNMDNMDPIYQNNTKEFVYQGSREVRDDFPGNKKDILIIVFLSAIGLYLIVSIIIYFASYIIKNKGDAIAEEFLKELERKETDKNYFFMDPNIPNASAGKSPKATEAYKNLEKDYNSLFDDINNKNDRREKNNYLIKTPIATPITTPVSIIEPTPDMRYSNEFNNMKGYNSDKNYISPPIHSHNNQIKSYIKDNTEYDHRVSGSTCSSAASVTNLLTKDSHKSDELSPNIDEIRPRTSSESRSKHIKRPPRNIDNEKRSSLERDRNRANSNEENRNKVYYNETSRNMVYSNEPNRNRVYLNEPNRNRSNSYQQTSNIQQAHPSILLHKSTTNRSSQIRFGLGNQKSPSSQPLINYNDPLPPSIPPRQNREYYVSSSHNSNYPCPPPPSQRNPLQRSPEPYGVNINSRY